MTSISKFNDFHQECAVFWLKAITAAAGPNPGNKTVWNSLAGICTALKPFMGSNRNHAHYPTGGGMDFYGVESHAEAGCIAFSRGDRMADVVKPKALTLEYFEKSPADSFLLLELAALSPIGENLSANDKSEGLVELSEGHYGSWDLWDRGYLGIDQDGREIPLPKNSRLIKRWFSGKILIVSKGSFWNGLPETYDGRHNKMSAAEIRQAIQSAIIR